MHHDHLPYLKLTTRARLEKSVNSLLGIVEGISIDGLINTTEIDFLWTWLREHTELEKMHPFNELVPTVQAALADGLLTSDERDDIRWLCERLVSATHFASTTADLQRLQAILGGIASDDQITDAEVSGLTSWLHGHDHLKTRWPYDEMDTLVSAVMTDGKINDARHKLLQEYFSEFVAVLDHRAIVNPPIFEGTTIVGMCAVCPDVEFKGSKFCFTGTSALYNRMQLAETVRRLGGEFVSSVSRTVRYLVIGAAGNPCWTYACYGRKVEIAVQLRKSGVPLVILHENDFHDAVADHQ